MDKFQNKNANYAHILQYFKSLLKDNGLKFTTQREKILEVLYKNNQHLTPEDLHNLLQQKYPKLKIGIATVYRTLSLLEEANLVTSLSFGVQGKKYEFGAKKHHDHLICTVCGDITEFVDEEIEKRQQNIANKLGFKMIDHSMQIYGICAKCQAKQQEE